MGDSGGNMAPEGAKQDTGGVAPWLKPPSYSTDAPGNPALPWMLNAAPPPAKSPEPSAEPEFVVVPRDGAASPQPPAPARGAEPAGGWRIRESQNRSAPIVIPVSEALVPKPPPPSRTQRALDAVAERWNGATPRQRMGVSTAVGALFAGALLGMLFNTVFKATPQSVQLFPGKTYHVPAVLAGLVAGATASPQSSALLEGLTPLAPPDAHGEASAYTGTAGNVAYVLAVVQDNLGHSVMRFDADLLNQFPNAQTQTQVGRTAGGVTVSCGTVIGQSSSYQGCIWYNRFAFGAYIDNVAATPGAAMATLLPVLQQMTATTSTRGVIAG
jgi:hypothetical protein